MSATESSDSTPRPDMQAFFQSGQAMAQGFMQFLAQQLAAMQVKAQAAAATSPNPMGAMGAMGLASGWSTPAAGATAASLPSPDYSRFGFDTGTLATGTPQTTWWGDQGTAAASQAGSSFALLNQYLAGSSGGANGGMIAVAMSGPAWTQNSFLTKPQS